MACPHVSALIAQCYKIGICRSETGSELSIMVDLAYSYNQQNTEYGFEGDPFRPVEGKYFGYLVYGNQW
jgi:hypothetical protein